MDPLGLGDALVVVDVQNDFLPGGALAVPRGDEVVPVLNRYLAVAASHDVVIVATKDWHPPHHYSFVERGGPWPPHCIIDSYGAQLSDALRLPPSAMVITKGSHPDIDAYSGFDGTDLERRLRGRGVRRVFVGGLATDYCVKNTVIDALIRHFAVGLLVDAIRAVNAEPTDGTEAVAEMMRRGAVPVELGRVA